MNSTAAHARKRTVGRPRTSDLTRAEQLRRAKRVQREREGRAGQVEARVKLPQALARRLMFAARQEEFSAALARMLDSETVELARFPQLKLLCWNRRGEFIGARDAWNVYERNWRFVEPARLNPDERALIDRLSLRYGGGVLHV
jgi:hypothetical protein